MFLLYCLVTFALLQSTLPSSHRKPCTDTLTTTLIQSSTIFSNYSLYVFFLIWCCANSTIFIAANVRIWGKRDRLGDCILFIFMLLLSSSCGSFVFFEKAEFNTFCSRCSYLCLFSPTDICHWLTSGSDHTHLFQSKVITLWFVSKDPETYPKPEGQL